MIARLSTRILALDGRGGCRYFADYSQWERRVKHEADPAAQRAADSAKAATPAPPPAPAKKKLSYKEQQELAGMEASIHAAEKALAEAQVAMNDPKAIADHKRYAAACNAHAQAQTKLDQLFARWAELEAKG
jgi:ATP-binding cassette subfamily F protein uup